jgi:hypothetical protein
MAWIICPNDFRRPLDATVPLRQLERKWDNFARLPVGKPIHGQALFAQIKQKTVFGLVQTNRQRRVQTNTLKVSAFR